MSTLFGVPGVSSQIGIQQAAGGAMTGATPVGGDRLKLSRLDPRHFATGGGTPALTVSGGTVRLGAYQIRSTANFNGKAIDPNATFLVVTNNYRAYGGKFAGTGDSHIAFASPDENRSVLAAWISAESKKAGEIHPAVDNNWRLAPIHSDTKLDIRFETSPSDKAAAFIKEKAQYPMKQVATDDIGFAIYHLDLSK